MTKILFCSIWEQQLVCDDCTFKVSQQSRLNEDKLLVFW